MQDGLLPPEASEGGSKSLPSFCQHDVDPWKVSIGEKLHQMRKLAIAKGVEHVFDTIVIPWWEFAQEAIEEKPIASSDDLSLMMADEGRVPLLGDPRAHGIAGVPRHQERRIGGGHPLTPQSGYGITDLSHVEGPRTRG